MISSDDAYPGSDRLFKLALDNGSTIELRPALKSDRDWFADGISQMSPEMRYLRFFFGFNEPPEWLLDLLCNVDGQQHLAWCAMDPANTDHPAVGAVHAIDDPRAPGNFELAVAVVDAYQGLGVARLLLAALIHDCFESNIEQVYAEVLTQNRHARRLFSRLGSVSESKIDVSNRLVIKTELALHRLTQMTYPQVLLNFLEQLKAN